MPELSFQQVAAHADRKMWLDVQTCNAHLTLDTAAALLANSP